MRGGACQVGVPVSDFHGVVQITSRTPPGGGRPATVAI